MDDFTGSHTFLKNYGMTIFASNTCLVSKLVYRYGNRWGIYRNDAIDIETL